MPTKKQQRENITHQRKTMAPFSLKFGIDKSHHWLSLHQWFPPLQVKHPEHHARFSSGWIDEGERHEPPLKWFQRQRRKRINVFGLSLLCTYNGPFFSNKFLSTVKISNLQSCLSWEFCINTPAKAKNLYVKSFIQPIPSVHNTDIDKKKGGGTIIRHKFQKNSCYEYKHEEMFD